MKIFKGKTDLYLSDTGIENLFIYEYMIPADGNYVKVYLLAKMFLENEKSVFNETLAKELNLTVKQVLDAWNYWEAKKVIKKHYTGSNPEDFDIEFVCLKELMYKGEEVETEEFRDEATVKLNSASHSDNLIRLLNSIEKKTSGTLNPKEFNDLKLWSEDWGLSAEVILKAYDIAMSRNKQNRADHAYVSSIIKSWYENGLFNMESLEDYLSEHDKRHNLYKRIFKALGFFGRFPTEEEKRIMDVWLDEYMLDISTILEACKRTSGISNPSINYINTILKDWKKSDKVTPSGKKKLTAAEIDKMYQGIREENDKISRSRQEEIYSRFPRIREIDEELRELNPKRLKLMLSGQRNSSECKGVENEMLNLRNEKSGTLKNAGYPEDYLAKVYTCPRCKDTGFLDNGEKCVCLTQKLMNS